MKDSQQQVKFNMDESVTELVLFDCGESYPVSGSNTEDEIRYHSAGAKKEVIPQLLCKG